MGFSYTPIIGTYRLTLSRGPKCHVGKNGGMYREILAESFRPLRLAPVADLPRLDLPPNSTVCLPGG